MSEPGAPIVAQAPQGSPLHRSLEGHPYVRVEGGDAFRFRRDAWEREVRTGDPSAELFGLTELVDNNPMMCADVFSVPNPIGTLASIALGPLAKAGLIVDVPVLQVSFEDDLDSLGAFVETLGWSGGVTVDTEPQDLGTALAMNALIPIRTPDDWDDVDAIFDECFGRSYYVRREEAQDWDVRLVTGRPFACYRLGMTPGDDTSLLTVRTMADVHGKCGAAQLIHAMNVMSGFEETVGIGESTA